MCKRKLELNSNQLKIIAIICMTIDHIAYFFFSNQLDTKYIIFRSIGRIAMPIFVFLLVEGYFHTKNIKKYIFRIFICAVATQLVIYFFEKIDIMYLGGILPKLNIFNILFSFLLILFGIVAVDKKIFQNYTLNIVIKATLIASIFEIYSIFKIDYGIYGFFIALMFYFINKYFYNKDKTIVNIFEMIFIAIFSVLAIKNIFGIFAALSIVFIRIYNGKKGNKSKILSTFFYCYFPIHYLIIFIVRLIFYYLL